jgi:hypothetical protein
MAPSDALRLLVHQSCLPLGAILEVDEDLIDLYRLEISASREELQNPPIEIIRDINANRFSVAGVWVTPRSSIPDK